jgi:hypothetical protein
MTTDYEAQVTGVVALNQLRDLYERVPFVRGRARVELLRQLQRVRLEVRNARLARPVTPVTPIPPTHATVNKWRRAERTRLIDDCAGASESL